MMFKKQNLCTITTGFVQNNTKRTRATKYTEAPPFLWGIIDGYRVLVIVYKIIQNISNLSRT